MISDIFDGVKSKIRFISVMEEAINTPPNMRTKEQQKELSKSMPWQLVEKIDKFKENESEVYDFKHHPDDEFWIIADVDDHNFGAYTIFDKLLISNGDSDMCSRGSISKNYNLLQRSYHIICTNNLKSRCESCYINPKIPCSKTHNTCGCSSAEKFIFI